MNQTSAISRNRRIVDLVAAAAGVLSSHAVRLRASKARHSRMAVYASSLDLRDRPGTTSHRLLAGLAVPDSNRVSLDSVLSAERADVAGMLSNFHLLHLLPQGGTISVVLVVSETCLTLRPQVIITVSHICP
jgi:hypothetical protein